MQTYYVAPRAPVSRAEIDAALAAEFPPEPPVEVTARELRTLGRRLLKSEHEQLREAGRALEKMAARERYSAPHTTVEHDPWRCADCARDCWWVWALGIAHPNADADAFWVRFGALQGLRADEIAIGLRDAGESGEFETPDETRARWLASDAVWQWREATDAEAWTWALYADGIDDTAYEAALDFQEDHPEQAAAFEREAYGKRTELREGQIMTLDRDEARAIAHYELRMAGRTFERRHEREALVREIRGMRAPSVRADELDEWIENLAADAATEGTET